MLAQFLLLQGLNMINNLQNLCLSPLKRKFKLECNNSKTWEREVRDDRKIEGAI
jgi:hypothetical protein